jgi:linoleoyl-CoA desaturase
VVASEQLTEFAAAIDRIGARERASLGPDDVAYARRLETLALRLGRAGRVLIVGSLEPVTFSVGVALLASYKLIQAFEIGHYVLHGAYDELDPTGHFHSTTFEWEVPFEEVSWRATHNLRHHVYVNVPGRDPDVRYGVVRLSSRARRRWFHRLQLPAAMLGIPFLGLTGSLHVQSGYELVFGTAAERPEPHFDMDRSPRALATLARRALRKAIRFYGKNYVLYPALAGPLGWKLVVGNWLAERLRDLYIATPLMGSHTGDDIAEYPQGTRAGSRAGWYVMQVEATRNFAAPTWISILAGSLNYQIEHHLFPDLPPNRLRAIADEVRALCDKHGVKYTTTTYFGQTRRMMARIAQLARM